MSLSWNASSGATSYKVKVGTSSSPWTVVSTQSGVTFTHTGRNGGTTYYYKVSAIDSSGESADSTQVSASPPIPTLTNLTANAGNGQVALVWSPYATTQGYRIKCGTSIGNYTMEKMTDKWTSYLTWKELTPYTTYYFVVQALGQHSAGNSEFTAPISATPYGIPANAPANLTATPGDGQIALGWNSVSRPPVTA